MRSRAIVIFSSVVLLAAAASAQTPAPAPPPKTVTGNVTFGLALTAGNKDTSTLNAGFEVTCDPKTRNVFKATGLALRGKSDGVSTAEQWSLTTRDEYKLSGRAFAFGELRYLHDRFKEITYLLAPTAGVGLKAIDTKPTTLSVSAGAGGVWEKNPGRDVRASGAVTAEEKLTHKPSETTTLFQSASALWKTSDFSDALYTFGAGIAATVVAQAQLKVEFLDTYKALPPDPTVKKNDIALIVGFVYKF